MARMRTKASAGWPPSSLAFSQGPSRPTCRSSSRRAFGSSSTSRPRRRLAAPSPPSSSSRPMRSSSKGAVGELLEVRVGERPVRKTGGYRHMGGNSVANKVKHWSPLTNRVLNRRTVLSRNEPFRSRTQHKRGRYHPPYPYSQQHHAYQLIARLLAKWSRTSGLRVNTRGLPGDHHKGKKA